MSDVLLYEISAEGLDLMIKRPVKKKRRGGREKRRKKKGWDLEERDTAALVSVVIESHK